MSATADPPTDAGEPLRRILVTTTERFVQAWEHSPRPPDLADYLPPDAPARRACLLELIKVDLEYRWLREIDPKRLTEYWTAFPELGASAVPPDLIYEELRVLRRAGRDDASLDDYTAAFPTQTAIVADALAASTQMRSTLLATPSTSALDRIESGDRVDDFDLLTDLGRGAFARVFLARQHSMQRLVAVKISQNHGTEPQTLAQLDHDYIVRVFDQRLVEGSDLKLMYMQYVPGGTLLGVTRRVRSAAPEQRDGRLLLAAVDDALARRGSIDATESALRRRIAELSWPETVAWLGVRLAEALDYADRRGVLHRDIKPANVLLTAEGVPKLADFNISFSNHVAGASPIAYFGGSLAYMSPEQLEACHPGMPRTAGDLDTRSDIYALGVLLWELLTGRRPFDDELSAGASDTSLERMLELRRATVDEQFLADLPSDCPASLRRILLTCLAPRRTDRWSSGAELAQQFELCMDSRARDLVDPPPRSWRARLAPWPIVVITLASGIGNLIGVLYNSAHNGTLLDHLLVEPARSDLHRMAGYVNLPAYLLVWAVTTWLCRRVLLVPYGLRRGRNYSPAERARARADTLRAGDMVALVAFGGWLGAGLAFAVLLAIYANLATAVIAHLILGIVVCGAIAVAYPFFIVSLYAVRCIYPTLLTYGETTGQDAIALRRLRARSAVYLAIAASVPLLGVLAGISLLPREQVLLVVGPIRWLCVGGVLGFVAAYWVFRKLEADLRALERVVAPVDAS